MRVREVGRWMCDKCRKPIVAAGPRGKEQRGTGAYMGPCPWSCGAWINRGFRSARPGQVSVYRAGDWDQMIPTP